MRDHEIVGSIDGFQKIKFTHEPFNDIVFSYAKVQLFDEGDHARLAFTYHIHEGQVDNEQEFKQELGDFLMSIIEQQLETKQLVYSGGIDEQNRIDNNQKPD